MANKKLVLDETETVKEPTSELLERLQLSQREWMIVFNCLVRQSYLIGDASLVSPIVTKIQPYAAKASDKDK
jgi:hypothetical protein